MTSLVPLMKLWGMCLVLPATLGEIDALVFALVVLVGAGGGGADDRDRAVEVAAGGEAGGEAGGASGFCLVDVAGVGEAALDVAEGVSADADGLCALGRELGLE